MCIDREEAVDAIDGQPLSAQRAPLRHRGRCRILIATQPGNTAAATERVDADKAVLRIGAAAIAIDVDVHELDAHAHSRFITG